MQNQWLGIILIAAAVIIGLGISVLVSRAAAQRLASMVAFLTLALTAAVSVVVMATFGNGAPTLIMALLCLILPSGAYVLTIVCINRKSSHTETETYFNRILRGDAQTDAYLDFGKPLEPAFEGGGALSPSFIAPFQKESEMPRTVSQGPIAQVQETIVQAAVALEREVSTQQSFEQPASHQTLVFESSVTDKLENDVSGLGVSQALREMIEGYTKQAMSPRPRQQENDSANGAVEQPVPSGLPIDFSAKHFKPSEPSQGFRIIEQPVEQVASGEEEPIEQFSAVCEVVEADTFIGEQNDSCDTVVEIMGDGKPLSAYEEVLQEEVLQEEPLPVQEELFQEEPLQEEQLQEEVLQEEPLQEEPSGDSPARLTFEACQAKAQNFVDKGVYDVGARLFEESAYLAPEKGDVQNALLLAVEYYVKANRLIDAKGIASELNNEIGTLSAGSAFTVRTVLGIPL